MCTSQRSVSYLLRKYETKQPGEVFVSQEMKQEYNNRRWRMKQKIRTCNIIMNQLNIQGPNRDRCLYIVKHVNLNTLHRKLSCEAIITAICFYIKKLDNPRIRLSDYHVCKEYGLNENNFSLIICRLCDYFQKE